MTSSINNLLFSVQNMSPALLGIGAGRSQSNYTDLAAMTGQLLNEAGAGGALSDLSDLFGTGGSTDNVTFAYKNIGDKIITDLAGVTADAIKENPSLDDDYVIALIDNGTGTREARVYSRKTILENFQGTEAEKAALKEHLDSNPLMVFGSGSGLPPTADDPASQALAKNINDFLKSTNKTLNTLDKAGYDPLADLLGDSTMKKILANCATPVDLIDLPGDDSDPESTDKVDEGRGKESETPKPAEDEEEDE